ncbi:MAG: DoxX family membrane protein [Patescibacteria group bacterium]
MFSSAKYSYLALRLGLAAVFFWFGISKIIHPSYWLNAWMTTSQFIYLCGVFEILAGVSLATGIFSKFFSALAILFLAGTVILVSPADVIIRDVGLIGGLVAVFLWPAPRDRF